MDSIQNVSPLMVSVSGSRKNRTVSTVHVKEIQRILTTLMFIILTLFYTNKPKISGHKIRRMPKAMRNVLTLFSPKPVNQTIVFYFIIFLFLIVQ